MAKSRFLKYLRKMNQMSLRRALMIVPKALPAFVLCLGIQPALLFAQDGETASADKAGWMLGYALVVLAIALGLTAVCRPGTRSKEIKVDQE